MCYCLSSWCGYHFGTSFVLHFHWKWELWALCSFWRPLLCCLCCTVYLPSGLLTRCSALVCAPTVQPMLRSVSVDRTPPLPPPTPTLPPLPVTGATLGKDFWKLVLPPLPLLALSLPCWSRVSDTWALPAINHGNRGDRGGVAGISRGRSVWGLMAVIDLSVHHPSTPFLPSLTSNTAVLTQTPPQLQSPTLSRFLLPIPITRNKVIWFVSTPVKTTKDSLFLSSLPSQLGPKRNVQKLWNSWKVCWHIVFDRDVDENSRRRECVDLTPPGYKLQSFPRATRGGGLAVIYRDHFPVTFNTTFPFTHTSFELVQLQLTAPHHIHFFCLYRPPPSRKNKLTDASGFLEVTLQHSARKTVSK